jgi:hypothetical protein
MERRDAWSMGGDMSSDDETSSVQVQPMCSQSVRLSMLLVKGLSVAYVALSVHITCPS